MPREIGIVSTALSLDLRESLQLARTGGFDGVQIELRSRGNVIDLAALGRSGQRELLALISATNLRLLSLATTAGRAGFSVGADVDRAVDHLDAAMRTAADLGRAPLVVDLGPLPPPPPPEVAAPKKVDPAMAGLLILPESTPTPPPPAGRAEARDLAFEAQLDAALIELGRRADRYGVVVAFRSELGALASLHRTLGVARCPFFTIDLDPVAVLRDEWDLEQTLASFTGRIGHLRVRDALKGTAGRTQPAAVGRGDTDFAALLRALDDAAYAGPLVIDPIDLRDRPTAAAAARGHLRSVMG